MIGGRSAGAIAFAGAILLAASPAAADATTGPAGGVEAAARARGASYPLVFLVQGDAVVDAVPAAGAALPGAATNDPPFGSGLRLRRLRVGEDVASAAWRARVVLEIQSRDQRWTPVEGGRLAVPGAVRLTDAFGAWAPHRAFQLGLGVQRVPFSLSRQVDEADLRLPERAQILTTVAPDFRPGVTLASDLGLLQLRGAFLSADTHLDGRLVDSGFLAAVRLSADPIGPMGVTPWRRRTDDPWYGWWRFSGGVSALYGTWLGARHLALGADAQVQWLRATATAEYIFVNAASGHDQRQGAVLEPGLFLWRERLELVLRGAWYRRALELAPGLTEAADTLAGGAGLTLYTLHARMRFQAAFERRRTPNDASVPDSDWALFRATLAI